MLPAANLYCYGQVDQRHYSDSFIEVLSDLGETENMVMTRIPNDEAIYDAIKLFLGKGK